MKVDRVKSLWIETKTENTNNQVQIRLGQLDFEGKKTQRKVSQLYSQQNFHSNQIREKQKKTTTLL